MLSDDRKNQSIYLGDRVTVQTIRGLKGTIIGRLPDGRAMLFDRESPYLKMIGPDQLVECNVVHVSERYVIVDPIREPEPFKREPYTGEPKQIEILEDQEVYDDPLLENLRILSEKGEWETAILARALRHIIDMLAPSPPTGHSTQNTDVVAEETPVENPPVSPASDESLGAASSSGLAPTEATESNAPESEFLRYLNGNQEEINEDDLISANIEDFGSVIDLPKDVRLLTMVQTRYLKQQHLKGIEGYDKIENLSTIFVEASALKNGEYGNVFYATRGTNPWNKVHKIIIN